VSARQCDGSCGGHQCNLGTACLDKLIPFPWRDLYPLAGQTVVLPDGETATVLCRGPNNQHGYALDSNEVAVFQSERAVGAGPWYYVLSQLRPLPYEEQDSHADDAAYAAWNVDQFWR